MKKILLLRRYSVGLSLSSILYGGLLLFYPQIIQTFHVYYYINNIFDYKLISLLFVVLGASNLLGIIFNVKKLRKGSVFALMFLWIMFSVAFLLASFLGDSPSSIVVLGFSESYLCWCINLGEGG